jgi:hypothetical protein
MENAQLRYSLRQLRYFVVTAEVLSFTAASKIRLVGGICGWF